MAYLEKQCNATVGVWRPSTRSRVVVIVTLLFNMAVCQPSSCSHCQFSPQLLKQSIGDIVMHSHVGFVITDTSVFSFPLLLLDQHVLYLSLVEVLMCNQKDFLITVSATGVPSRRDRIWYLMWLLKTVLVLSAYMARIVAVCWLIHNTGHLLYSCLMLPLCTAL